MSDQYIEHLIKIIAKLPSLGTRSARRIVLQLLKKKETLIPQLIQSLKDVEDNITVCEICGNYDTQSPCSICSSTTRERNLLCIVQDISDLWALERGGLYKGLYHVLGGVLSAIEGVTPDDLNIGELLHRIEKEDINEIILALPATVDGQITIHYISSLLKGKNIKISTLAQGIPVGAELDYIDDGTIKLALDMRKQL
ncbi:MAG: recombination protein RecR [Alphaproteobacteria bacterium]|nr:recombination protein RecR [Alphaproteobacteria bacterium]